MTNSVQCCFGEIQSAGNIGDYETGFAQSKQPAALSRRKCTYTTSREGTKTRGSLRKTHSRLLGTLLQRTSGAKRSQEIVEVHGITSGAVSHTLLGRWLENGCRSFGALLTKVKRAVMLATTIAIGPHAQLQITRRFQRRAEASKPLQKVCAKQRKLPSNCALNSTLILKGAQ